MGEHVASTALGLLLRSRTDGMDLSLMHADKIGTGTHPPDMIFPISTSFFFFGSMEAPSLARRDWDTPASTT